MRGDYGAPLLPVGKYRVEVDQPGFQKEVVSNITINTNETVRVDACWLLAIRFTMSDRLPIALSCAPKEVGNSFSCSDGKTDRQLGISAFSSAYPIQPLSEAVEV